MSILWWCWILLQHICCSQMYGDLYPILSLSNFNCYMHIPILRRLLSDMYGNLLNRAIMLFLLLTCIVIYIFLFFSITVAFYRLLGNTNLINGKFCILGWLWPLEFLPPSLNPYCSFAITIVLTQSKHAGKRAESFLCSHLGLHINYSKSKLHLTQQLSFWGLCWNIVDMSVSLPSDKLIEIQELTHAFFTEASCYNLSCYVLFRQDHLLSQWT